MYTDGSIDGEAEGRDAQSPTTEEWQRLEEAFDDGPAKEIILALRRTDNSPQDVALFGARMRTGSVGGINTTLLRKEIPFRLELVYTEGPFRENQVYLKRVSLPRPKIVETPRENSRRCC